MIPMVSPRRSAGGLMRGMAGVVGIAIKVSDGQS
jgi:hypothetical protein